MTLLAREQKDLQKKLETQSPFPAMYIRDMLARTMHEDLGIVRERKSLQHGLDDIDYYTLAAERMHYDSSVSAYTNYSPTGILATARATLSCALARKESRGAHYRSDYPNTSEAYSAATLVSYDDGESRVWLDKEGLYEG